ncbi:Proteasome, subunit alpha/beta [Trema orientale]|uniref:Proteasome, subunit alpha/beta n=1 Tax=Trema orientale TaxID=63057 RepID=A0A2P5FD28_TREOI|nr:Proteasome, subunit alpha/beta [Trema orientale]
MPRTIYNGESPPHSDRCTTPFGEIDIPTSASHGRATVGASLRRVIFYISFDGNLWRITGICRESVYTQIPIKRCIDRALRRDAATDRVPFLRTAHCSRWNMPLKPLRVHTTQALCDLGLRFGWGDEASMSRPFGVSLLIAGHDKNGPSLHYHSLSGVNIASPSLFAMSSRSKIYCNYDFILPPLDLTLKEAETIALSILKQIMEEKVTPNNV